MQIVKLQHQEFDLFATYFENKSNIVENVNTILNEVNQNKHTFFVGDFNTGTHQQRNQHKKCMQLNNFKLLFDVPTHEGGNTLDNIAKNFDNNASITTLCILVIMMQFVLEY